MAITFPTTLDVLVNKSGTLSLAEMGHASQHADVNDAVEAIEVKVGVDNSTDPNSLDYKVTVLQSQIAVVAAYNLYKDGANYKYTANGTGSIIIQDGLTVTIYSAPAGNADDIAVLTSMCEWTLTTGDMVAGDATLDTLNGLTIPASPGTLATQAYAKGHNQQIFPAEKTVTLTVSTPDIATIPQYVHRTDEIQLSSNGGSGTLMDSAQLEVDGIIMVHLALTTKPTITGGTSADVFIPTVDIHYQTTGVNTKQKAPNFYV